ncbi:MAG: hypothetical protein JOS17DRAFT_766203 [Linnemannia elongata]|nr:MAG: hypothetical protein JOS17DRAFT_766203 [Linnemannia elongata]
MSCLSKLTKTPIFITIKLLQHLILELSLALLTYTISYLRCRVPYFPGDTLPSPQAFFSSAIPLFCLLPVYFVTTIVSPILLLLKSRYGDRPTWLSAKERCFSIMIPALITLGLALYFVSPPVYRRALIALETMGSYSESFEEESTVSYCRQWHPQPYLALALSVLALFETLITYRFDTQSHLQDQDQKLSPAPLSATCRKLFCLHECVSITAHKNMSAISSISSTYCSSVRLIRNVRAITVFIGFIYLIFSIAYLSVDNEDSWRSDRFFYRPPSSKWSLLPAHIYSFLLWLFLIIFTIRPSVTRPAQNLYPVLRVILTLIPALGLVSWRVLDTIYAFGNNCGVNLRVFYNQCTLRLAPAAWGIVFGLLVVIEASLTFVFDRRRYNTAKTDDIWMALQKYAPQQQQQPIISDTEIELLVQMDDGKFQLPEQSDSKN